MNPYQNWGHAPPPSETSKILEGRHLFPGPWTAFDWGYWEFWGFKGFLGVWSVWDTSYVQYILVCILVHICIYEYIRVRIFLLSLCIVYFVYFTNYFCVRIFVYLLTINFVRVLIVYFQNIVYSCITINFTISYVKIAHIYYIHARAITVYTRTFVTLYEFACTCAVYSTFLNASTDTVYHMRSVTKVFKGGGRSKTR